MSTHKGLKSKTKVGLQNNLEIMLTKKIYQAEKKYVRYPTIRVISKT